MHSYSLDTEVRKVVIVTITVISVAIQSALKNWQSLIGISESLLIPISFGVIFGLLYFIFDKFVWKYLTSITNVPDLSGEWECTGNSSYKEDDISYEFPLKLIIKQNFSKIEIQADQLSLENWESIDWGRENQILLEAGRQIKEKIKEKRDTEIHYFGLTSIPSAFYLGSQFGSNLHQIRAYNRNHKTKEWGLKI